MLTSLVAVMVAVVELSAVEAAQCRSSARQGHFQAIDSLNGDGLDCPAVLARQDEIVDLFLQSADLPVVDFTQACFLDGFREEIVSQIDAGVGRCSGRSGQLFSAGFLLGSTSCRLHGAKWHNDLLRISLPPAPSPSPFAELLVPVSSETWRLALSKQSYAGAAAGCLSGLQASARQRRSPFLDGAGGADWQAAGQAVGKRFGEALCGQGSLSSDELAAALSQANAGPAFEAARAGVIQGWGSACAQ